MNCACGSQDGEYKQGISKKNGKPYRGWKCSQCQTMQFLPTNGNGGTNYPSKPVIPAQTTGSQSQLLAEMVAIRKLMQVLVEKITKQVQIADTELQPDEEAPF